MMFAHLPEHARALPMELPPLTGPGVSFPIDAKDCPKKRGDRPGKTKAPARKKGTATEAVEHSGGGEVLVWPSLFSEPGRVSVWR